MSEKSNENRYLVLINFEDKHRTTNQLYHCFEITTAPVAKPAVILYKKDNASPVDTDDRAFFYTDIIETNTPIIPPEEIMDYFNNSGFTQGRFSYVVIDKEKDSVMLDANTNNFSTDGYLPPPDNVINHYQCEIDYLQKLAHGGFDFI